MKKLFCLVSLVLLPATFLAAAEPELPRLYVETVLIPPTGRTIEVKAGGNLQAAIDQATYGDEIVLESGAEFTGAFVLKKKSPSTSSGQAGWITIRSSNMSGLPSQGERVNPSLHASAMAKVKSPGSNVPAISAAEGANGYRIIGIEFTKSSSASLVNLIFLGGDKTASLDLMPSHIILDRIYAHGDPESNLRRCITLNGAYMAVIDSYISDCHEIGADSQAIGGAHGPGPFKIINNYLEGAGENVMFGGSDPSITDLVPSDIEIRGNHFYKPLSWKIGDPSYAGKAWLVKNLLETKNARRVLIDGNLFENSWAHGQTGVAIIIKSANQNGRCVWCVSSDITFSNNIIRNAAEGITINAYEGTPAPEKAARIKIENVLFESVTGKLFQIYKGVSDVTIKNVTAYSPRSILFGDGGDGSVNPGFVVKDSVLSRGRYGVGAGSEEGIIYLDKWFPGAVFENNVIVNAGVEFSNSKILKWYPAGTMVVSTKDEVPSGAGADINKINAAMKIVNSKPAVVNNAPPVITPNNPPNVPETPAQTSSSSGGGGSSRGSSSSGVTSAPGSVAEIQAKIAVLMMQIAAYQNGNPNASVQAQASKVPTGDLTVGSTGGAVVSLQQMLVSQGHLVMPPGVAMGYFGPLTRAAVAKWQAANGVFPAAGYWGPISRARLEAL